MKPILKDLYQKDGIGVLHYFEHWKEHTNFTEQSSRNAENKGLILIDKKGKVWYNGFMRFLLKIKEKPAINPKDASRIVNVNKIANSIEKANRVLIDLHSGATGRYNEDAIATWERIIAALRMKWRDALVEVQTDGRYSFD